MSPVRTFRLDMVVDGAGADVVVRLGAGGQVRDAWFDLDALPRVEGLLRGRPVTDVPTMIEHLCGICPVAHHLAGARALDAFAGVGSITPTAETVRRLLHYGAVLQTHARQLAQVDPRRALRLEAYARQVVSAAGGASHFPVCAVPGGVAFSLTVADRQSLASRADVAVEEASDLGKQIEALHGLTPLPTFTGHDLALVDNSGALDLYGEKLRAVAADNTVVLTGASAAEWPDLVAESRPGASASRPFLLPLGPDRGGYRVGPVAQLRVATHLSTDGAESARERWGRAGGGAAWARAVVALHAAEVIQDLLSRPQVAGDCLVEPGVSGGIGSVGASTVTTGWVDGARGLLVHTYRVAGDGRLTDATITTPTAQNEGWLAALLLAAARDHAISAGSIAAHPPQGLAPAMEAAVREADPCLPCTSLPFDAGMRLNLTVTDAQGNTLARWALGENPSMAQGHAATALEPGRV
jgi:NAD-reducing hydrogenase large subunit